MEKSSSLLINIKFWSEKFCRSNKSNCLKSIRQSFRASFWASTSPNISVVLFGSVNYGYSEGSTIEEGIWSCIFEQFCAGLFSFRFIYSELIFDINCVFVIFWSISSGNIWSLVPIRSLITSFLKWIFLSGSWFSTKLFCNKISFCLTSWCSSCPFSQMYWFLLLSSCKWAYLMI